MILIGFGGCAASNDTGSLLTPVAAASSSSTHELSADEQALECKQLMGRMQIRILEIRDYNERNTTTLASRALQSGVGTVFGGTTSGLDPNGQYAKDRAMLEAYNKQLAAKGCKSYDLNAELQPKDFRVSPAATIKPAGGKAP